MVKKSASNIVHVITASNINRLSRFFNRYTQQFLQRVSIAYYAERCISCDRFSIPPSDRLSDRLTIRLSHSGIMSKPLKLRSIMRSSLEDSPMTLVSSWLTSARNSKGNRERGRRMMVGWGKIGTF